jgi:hypothetical protein
MQNLYHKRTRRCTKELLIFLREPSCPSWFMQRYFLESGSTGTPFPSLSVWI